MNSTPALEQKNLSVALSSLRRFGRWLFEILAPTVLPILVGVVFGMVSGILAASNSV